MYNETDNYNLNMNKNTLKYVIEEYTDAHFVPGEYDTAHITAVESTTAPSTTGEYVTASYGKGHVGQFWTCYEVKIISHINFGKPTTL